MIIRDILDMKGGAIHAIAPDRPVSEAVHEMVRRNIGSLLVMEGDTLLGIITPHDVLRALDACRCDLTAVAVKDTMTKAPITGTPEDSVDDVRGILTEHHFSHLPVLENGKPVGLISFYDVARMALKEASFENMLLKRYIKNWPEEDQA